MYNFLMLNLVVHKETARPQKVKMQVTEPVANHINQ